MNIPFKFTYAATNDYGVLFNPHGEATTGTDKANSVLAALPDLSVAELVPPLNGVRVTGLTVMTDDAGDVPVTLGWWDVTNDVFYALYPILATSVAGGGVQDMDFGEGYRVPVGNLLCLRNDGAAGGVVSGHVRLYVQPADTVGRDGGPQPLLDEQNGYALTDELNHPILQN